MVQTTPTKSPMEQACLIRALSSLSRRDVDAVRATLRATGSDLTVEEHDDYDGYLSLLLVRADGGGLGYVVSGRAGAVELAKLDGDELTVLGNFAGIGPAMLKLRAVLNEREHAAQIKSGAANITSLAAALLEHHGRDADLHAAIRADAEESWKPVLRAVDVLKRLPPIE